MDEQSTAIFSLQESNFSELTRPLAPEEFARIFPHVLRIIPSPEQTPEVYRLEPHPGEHHRYGVFFWSFKNPTDLQAGQNNRVHLLLTAKDLFENTGIPPELLSKGIIVDSSPYCQELRNVISNQRRQEKTGENPNSSEFKYRIEEEIARKNIVLDCGPTYIGQPPMLSIPCPLTIEKSRLLP